MIFFFFLIGIIFLIRTYESIYINCIFHPPTFLLNQTKEFLMISLLCHPPTKYHEGKLNSLLSLYFFIPFLFSIFPLFNFLHQTEWEYLKGQSYKNRIGIGKLGLEMPHKKAQGLVNKRIIAIRQSIRICDIRKSVNN